MIIKRSTIITGLDIGSSKISAVTAEIDRTNRFRILAHATQVSKGVSRGSIIDLDGAVGAVSRTLGALRDKIAGSVGDIYVNISGETVRGQTSRGMVPISLRGREITKLDMEKCVNAAAIVHLPYDRDIVHRIVHNFSVDDQRWVKDPLGLYASRLSCEVYILTADVNNIQNIQKCVNSAGYDVKEVVFTGMADAASLLEAGEIKEGACLVDLGSSLTAISVFFDGSLADMEVVTTGAGDIGDNFKDSAEFNGLISRISSRLREFAQKAGKTIPVTLTGGMAFTEGVVEFLEEKLSAPVKMGVAKEVRGDISGADSVRLPAAIGLVKYAYDKYEKRLLEEKGLVKNLSSRVVDILNNYF